MARPARVTCERRATFATIKSIIPEGGPCRSLGLGLKAETSLPPSYTVARAPLRGDGEGSFSKITGQSLV